MKVRFTQSGGFAGLIRQCTLDTATMAADERQRLEELIQQSGLSASSQDPVSSEELSRGGRDLETYEIAIEDGTRKISIVRDNSTAAPPVKALVGYLKKCARPAGLK